jgi:hypothetical protein
VLRIVLDESTTDPNASGLNVLALEGHWKGDRLEAEHKDERGSVKQTLTLKENGRVLEVKTKVEGRRSFEVKRVYVREAEARDRAGSK